MTVLENAYKELFRAIHWEAEPFSVVECAEMHRNHWKPKQIKTLLLAESHVYTSAIENAVQLHEELVSQTGCPNHFVKLVYCLGYGDNTVLNSKVLKNPGTWQYWELFRLAAEGATGLSFEKARTIDQKISLLNTLKDNGVWLLDACPIGLYGSDPSGIEIKKAIRNYPELMNICWETYTRPQIENCRPEKIILIGKMIWNNLHNKLSGWDCDWIYQPNARQGKNYDFEHSPKTLKKRVMKV
ncbi:MAG: hypothetical protein AB7P76_04120 [Candidatus Melainabacteria bacterium]